MTWTVTIYPYNIFEIGTLLLNMSGDSGFPNERLFDRSISLFWKSTGTNNPGFRVQQDPVNQLDIDFVGVSKHNFVGEDILWQWSNDNVVWNNITNWIQPDNNQIIRTWSSLLNYPYFALFVTTLTDPMASEIYMSKGYTFNPLQRRNPYGRDIENIQRNRTVGGLIRTTKLGAKRRARVYEFWMSAAEFASFTEAMGYLDDYSKPFYFKDHEDNYFMAQLAEPPDFNFDHETYTMVTIRIEEIL